MVVSGLAKEEEATNSSAEGATDYQPHLMVATEGETTPIQCYRCFEHGHVAIGCRTRVDHLRRQPLNSNGLPRQGNEQS